MEVGKEPRKDELFEPLGGGGDPQDDQVLRLKLLAVSQWSRISKIYQVQMDREDYPEGTTNLITKQSCDK